MKKFLLGTITTAILAFSGSAMAAQFVAGTDYTVIPKPIKVERPGKIEVREFFWYGCPHCFTLEPHMQTWLKQLPKDVRFVRTPAAMNPLWEQGAFAKFYTRYGVPEAKFNSTFKSFAVSSKIAQAKSLAAQYQLSGVPAITVNGKYIVQGEDARTVEIVKFLVDKERKAK